MDKEKEILTEPKKESKENNKNSWVWADLHENHAPGHYYAYALYYTFPYSYHGHLVYNTQYNDHHQELPGNLPGGGVVSRLSR